MSNSVWMTACRLLVEYLADGRRVDFLLEALPADLPATERRRVRHSLYGVVRHLGLLDHVVHAHVHRRPRVRLRAVLLMGLFEIMERPGEVPLIVHHAVGQARHFTSPGEAGLVNAVLRRAGATLQSILTRDPSNVGDLALRFSHPQWLVERWVARFGLEDTRALLTWDQTPAPVHARVVFSPEESAPPLPDGFTATSWPGFYVLERPDWAAVEALIAAGRIYLQDPATAVAPGLLAVQPGETVLDLCAAPGGKSLQLAGPVGDAGRVVAVDLPGPRLERMRANVARYSSFPITVVGCDAAEIGPETLRGLDVPGAYDAVLVDVPCSNTGVLRHRVDARWRLQPADLEQLTVVQGRVLRSAASLVRPGGRLVYSTCSLEPEENEDLVAAFLASPAGAGFVLERSELSRPWQSGCDGAGAFLLRRRATD